MAVWQKPPCWLLCLVLALILGVGGCGPSGTAPEAKKESIVSLSPEALEHLRRGQKLLADNKLDEALKEFQETARLAPDSPLAQFWLGRAYYFHQDHAQAEKAFNQVLQLDPKNYQAMIGLGRIYSLDRNKLDQAQKLLQQALDESPDNLEGRFILGVVYTMKGEQQKALNQFSFTFAKESEIAIYHFEIGRILENSGDKKRALQHYQRALVLNPKLTVADQAAKGLAEDAGKEVSIKAQPAPKTGKPQTSEKKPAR
jgi:tetratricopeptide (TPR) repeat protein